MEENEGKEKKQKKKMQPVFWAFFWRDLQDAWHW